MYRTPRTVAILALMTPVASSAYAQEDSSQARVADRRQAAAEHLPAQPVPLSDGALAEWLTPQIAQAQSVSQFAAKRAADERVRRIATRAALAYADLLNEVEQATPQLAPAEETGRTDVSAELKEVVETIEDSGEVEAPRRAPTETQTRRETATTEAELEAPQAPEADEDGEDRRLLQREDGVVQRLRNATAERGERRGTARARLRRLMPALQESLPELVDLMTEAIEEGAQPSTHAWVELQRNYSDRYATSVQEELARYSGAAFDQAYLGYDVLTNLRLVEALSLVQSQAGTPLRPVLEEGVQTLTGLSRQSRQLMQEAPRGTRGE